MLLTFTPEIETIPYLTTVEEIEPNLSASGSLLVDYPYSNYEFLSKSNTERISKKVEDPTHEIYDFMHEYFYDFQTLKKNEEILGKITNEYSVRKNFVEISETDFFQLIDILIKYISHLNYQNISVELSPLNEIKFKIVLNEDTLLIITKPFEKLDTYYSKVFYSVFINKKSVLNDFNEIEELVEGINQFI